MLQRIQTVYLILAALSDGGLIYLVSCGNQSQMVLSLLAIKNRWFLD